MIQAEARNEERTIRKPKTAYAASDELSRRQTASAFALLRDAAGGPRAWATKLGRLGATIATGLDADERRRRLTRLRDKGLVEVEPTRLQLVLLGIDMLRYFIEPGARDYYESRGIDFSLHQVLRVLDDPCSMIDPVGLLSQRDVIIGHLFQVVHGNPVYDLQLLEMFEDGLAELETQAEAMVEGTHPRARSIGAIVEDPEYHARLLAYVRAYRRDPNTAELRRRAGDARSNVDFVIAEETFGALPSAFRYAAKLPRDPRAAIEHLRANAVIDRRLCDPEMVRAVEREFSA